MIKISLCRFLEITDSELDNLPVHLTTDSLIEEGSLKSSRESISIAKKREIKIRSLFIVFIRKERKKDAEIGNEEEEIREESPIYQEKSSAFSQVDSCKEDPLKTHKEKSQLSSQESLKPRQIFEVKDAMAEKKPIEIEKPIEINEKNIQYNESHSAGLGSNRNSNINLEFHVTPSFKTNYNNEKLSLIFIVIFKNLMQF